MAAVKIRKLARAADARPGREDGVLPALRIGFARAAKNVLDLPLAVIGIDRDRPEPDIIRTMYETGALGLIFQSGADLCAVAFVSADVVRAVIRHQTIGSLGKAVATDEPRVLTATDAALCTPLMQAGLAQLCDLAPEDAAALRLDGPVLCQWMPNGHDMTLAVGEARFFRVTLQVDLGAGAVSGTIVLLLRETDPVEEDKKEATRPRRTEPAEVFLNVRAELDAVLCRLVLPLTALSELSVGDVVPLSGATVENTALVTLTGEEVAQAVLGQLNGSRAVRLSGPANNADAGHVRYAVPAQFRPAESPSRKQTPDPEKHPAVADEDEDFGALSVEDAAAEITSLAGLTEDDLAEINAAATSEIVGQPV